jgi:DNA uptake protein ComE-like DNA-binding protein
MTLKRSVLTTLAAVVTAALLAAPARAQVGKPGVDDLNAISETALAALPGMTPAAAKAFVDKRPFATIVEANEFLLGQKLTPEQLGTIYEKAFIPLNLNTATSPEILLVPKIARRMTIEFAEYRPWKTMAQFDKEIGKYVGQPETDRLKQYVFIPLDLNTATDEQFLTIPNMARRMLVEFKEYRPWKTREQFDREIGKYVGPKETARLWRYVVINP